MWLTQKLTEKKSQALINTGTITENQEKPTIQAEKEYRDSAVLTPYGISSIPPKGATGLMVNGCYLGGESADNVELLPGEIRLRSLGGAEIYLKNNGEVWVNGKLFAPKEV